MSLLNIRLSSLALAFDPETDEWLLYENLEGVIWMKDVWYAVSQYDNKIPNALITMKRHKKGNKNQKYNDN